MVKTIKATISKIAGFFGCVLAITRVIGYMITHRGAWPGIR